MCLDSLVKNMLSVLPAHEEDKIYYNQSIRDDYKKTCQYAPWWVIVTIVSALCLEKMMGWKRVVKTVDNGIDKSHMTYAQGVCAQEVCAQLTATLAIATANVMGLPVSTTQILSSAVAGTTVTKKSGVKAATIKYITLAGLFTFPVAMVLSGGLYYVVSRFL